MFDHMVFLCWSEHSGKHPLVIFVGVFDATAADYSYLRIPANTCKETFIAQLCSNNVIDGT